MTARTPAETLRAAADRLDELAAETSPQPWEAVEFYPQAWLVRSPDQYELVKESGDGDITGPDAAWIAALGPQVADPLSAWLRDAADACDEYDALADPDSHISRMCADSDNVAGSYRHTAAFIRGALAFARPVLGETPTPDT